MRRCLRPCLLCARNSWPLPFASLTGRSLAPAKRGENSATQVIATVPKERLLVFRASDGWGPLCSFLDVAEPSVPYPNVNDTSEFKERLWANWRMAAAKEAALLLLAIGGAVALRRRF